MKTKLLDKGVLVGVAFKVGFIVTVLFLGYKTAIACSRNVFLQDYMASLQPGLVVSIPTSTDSSPSQASQVSPTLADPDPVLDLNR